MELVYDRVEDDFLEYSCECEAYFNYSGMCKHCVGVALKLLEHEQGLTNQYGEKNQPGWKSDKKLRATDQQVSKWIRSRSMKEKSRFFQAEITGRIELIPTLHFEEPGGWKLDFRIGAENVYVVKNISAMVEAVREQAQVEYGKKLKFYHQPEVFSPESRKILKFLEECVEQEQVILRQ